MSDKFCLKWNDFQSNVSKSFGALRSEEYLHDVTLVSDDHKKVSAHKLILSACSQYFKEIFKNNQHSHPLLCLDGISFEDLRNIMDYMYNGEVEIYQENLDRFLNVAQRLKLEGLIGGKEEKEESDIYENLNDDSLESSCNAEVTISVPVERRSTKEKVLVPLDKRTVLNTTVDNGTMEQVLQNLAVSKEGRYECKLCGKVSNENAKNPSSDMKKHMQTHMEGLTYTCHFCQKPFRSKNTLSSHKSQKH